MFKKILSLFTNKSSNNTESEDSKHQKENEQFDPVIEDETFLVDFISVRKCGETIKNSKVIFPLKNQYIIINDNQNYFDSYYVDDEGMSSDNLYHRISTPDYKFWISPKDYRRFMSVVNHRHNILLKNRQVRDERTKSDISTSFDYDPIDESIYKCFISNQTGMCDYIGTWEQFHKIEEIISNKCKEKGGKYYKTPAKSATFAIIFDPHCRVYSNVSMIRKKGYKVTTFEKVLEYFSLTEMWNCNKHSELEKESKKFMKDTYG